MTTKKWLYTDEEGLESEVELPAKWEICSTCNGETKHSHAIGAITSDEWEHDWSEDERESYLNGGYDRRCEPCNGTGKVLNVDLETLKYSKPILYKAYIEECKSIALMNQIQADEARNGA